jgi:hypothetical protein
MFSALKGLEISSVDDTWVKIMDSIKASAKEKVGVLERNKNKPWFGEECSELANKRRQQNYFCYKILTTELQKSLVMLGAIPVECSGKKA